MNPLEFDELAEKYDRSLRDGTKDLFKITYDTDIPVLVFSAGLGKLICLNFKFFLYGAFSIGISSHQLY